MILVGKECLPGDGLRWDSIVSILLKRVFQYSCLLLNETFLLLYTYRQILAHALMSAQLSLSPPPIHTGALIFHSLL